MQTLRRHHAGFCCTLGKLLGWLLVAAACHGFSDTARAVDVSPPPILQWFESSYETIIGRTPDVFMAGYGAVWTPPPGRADLGDFSVGYDVYDRFDLGRWDRPTLYGTETGIRRLADTLDTAGVDLHVDFVINHNGFSDLGTPGFYDSGGYPGFAITLPEDIDGDFHSPFWGGPEYERLAGLIDIAHEKNHRFIRSPVDPGDPRNLRPGTTPANGRIANVPDANNRRFYPDIGHNTIYVYDPMTGEGDIPIHQFNLDDPTAGDPVEENATGYLMRNAQWLVQAIGVDGLRIDAAKHVQGFVLDYLDRAVYRQNPRPLLDGSTHHVFSYSEVFDGDPAVLLPHVKKSIDEGQVGVVGGNRDTLDFKLYFALKDNLEHTGTNNAWYHVKDASLDFADDGLHNGSAGVKFVHNHDVFKPYELDNVAGAYLLMMPGNTVVYFNGKEFGDGRDFPKDGRGDALSQSDGVLGRLLDARSTHGRGNYAERWVDNQGLYVFERVSSAVVGLSNRGDGGFDSRSVEVGFAPGTHLVEISGTAENPLVDPYNELSEVLTVYEQDGKNMLDLRVPRNRNANGDWHGRGYVIYGLPTPQSEAGLELTNVASILPGDTTPENNYENGTHRRTDLYVIRDDAFGVRLLTREVRLLGLDSLRDVWADGDNALLKLDGGRDINGNGRVDFTTPGHVAYGFETFGEKASPLIGTGGLGGPRGDGEFLQTIDTTALEEGVHLLEARAFRHRTDGGPAVFSSFKKAIYVDRLPPESALQELRTVGGPGDTDVLVESLDFTADGVHVFLNLPETLGDEEIYAMVAQGQGRADRVDVNLFKKYFTGIGSGNHVFTLVSFEPTGTSNIQRLVGRWVDGRGSGLGDLDHDGTIGPPDIAGTGYGFEHVLYTQNGEFNPAADVNADGRVDNHDLFELKQTLAAAGARADTLDACEEVLRRRGDINGNAATDAWDIDELYRSFGVADWLADLSVDGLVDQGDVDLMVRTVLGTEYGDANLDTAIDVADLETLHDHWQGPGGWADGDFTGDGLVGATDLQSIALNWTSDEDFMQTFNRVFGVPEPGSVILLLSGAFFAWVLWGRFPNLPRTPAD